MTETEGMNMSDLAKIELSRDLIEPIVRAQLQASIVAAMGKKEELIGQVVQTVMNMKVDDKGMPSRYSDSKPLITWLAEDAIKEAAREAIKEWFAENRDSLKKLIRTAIQNNSKGLAESLVVGLAQGVECKYAANVTVVRR